MCTASIFGKPSTPSVQAAPTPTVAATAPPAEEVAEAPIVNEGTKRQNQASAQRRGTSALRINLNLGGGLGGAGGASAASGGGGNGVSIPR